MDRKRAKELLPIIEAFAEGKTVQLTTGDGGWLDITDDGLYAECLEDLRYRIKPEPREFWLDLSDYEVWVDQEKPPVPHAIKVREVLE